MEIQVSLTKQYLFPAFQSVNWNGCGEDRVRRGPFGEQRFVVEGLAMICEDIPAAEPDPKLFPSGFRGKVRRWDLLQP